MPMYHLIEPNYNYSKISRSSYQYYRDEPAIENNNVIVDFANNNTTNSFNLKKELTDQASNNGAKNVEIIVRSKYLNNF